MQVNIYIPTKGRCDNQKTAALLDKAGIDYYLVVEPKEKHLYKGNLIVLPKNDMGIAYSRNNILSHAKQSGIDWLIMIDDDISAFGVVEKKRCVTTGAEIINEFISRLEKLPSGVVLGTINYTQYAWCANKEFDIDSIAEVFVAINVKNIPNNISYDQNVFPDDRDFLLQVLVSGRKSIRFNRLWFSCPHIGSNKGGLYDLYSSGKTNEGVKMLLRKWGNIVSCTAKADGLYNIKIDRKNLKLLFK